MSNRPPASTDHPHELLAGYVDGSASADERRTVQAHLTACAQCREETDLARAARAALASLPQLEAPGLAARGLAGLHGTALRAVSGDGADGADAEAAPREAPRSARPKRQIAWVPALAAAAIVVVAGAIAVPIALRAGGGGAASRVLHPAAAPAGTPSPVPTLIDVGASYTPGTLESLANRLAPAAREAEFGSSGGATGGQTFGPATPAPGKSVLSAADQATSRSALDCLESGGGLEPGAIPLYLEAATFKGVPAYIGAFARPGTRLDFVMVAVSRSACQPLYTLARPA